MGVPRLGVMVRVPLQLKQQQAGEQKHQQMAAALCSSSLRFCAPGPSGYHASHTHRPETRIDFLDCSAGQPTPASAPETTTLRNTLLILCCAGLALATASVPAHEGATGIVKERMDYMKSLGEASKAIGAMYKGEAPYDGASLLSHAETLAARSDRLLDYFPEGSLEHPSEALPEIWEDWTGFRELAGQLQVDAALLAELARGDERRETRAQFARTGRTCSRCHQRFRQPQE